jgi:hypothetical protein
MIDLTLKQLIAGKTALFRVCEDPEFDDVRAIVNAVFPGELCDAIAELKAEVRDLNAMREADAEVAYSLRAERDQLQSWKESAKKEIIWRVHDIREMLLNGYGCDEWSTPTVNLRLLLELIDRDCQPQPLGGSDNG